MKYLLIVLLILVILALAIVATLAMNVTFDETAALQVSYCGTHAFLSVNLTLPEQAATALQPMNELVAALPRPLSAPALLTLRTGGSLLGGIRTAYRAENHGCTAFR